MRRVALAALVAILAAGSLGASGCRGDPEVDNRDALQRIEKLLREIRDQRSLQ